MFLLSLATCIFFYREAADLLKANSFAKTEFLTTKNCAETSIKNAIKNMQDLNKNIRLCQKHEIRVTFTTFAFKSQKFTNILKNFAQTCVGTSAAFRNSEGRI